jgi:DNA-binding MarR family transcriptional regulator
VHVQVDRIEAAGLLERWPAREDRRGVEIAITREGRAMAKRMWPVYAAAVKEHFADPLADDEAAALRDALGRVHASARGLRPAGP